MRATCSKGFSLTEMSLVIVIIGLIVAGVTGGNAILQGMKLQKVIRDLTRLHSEIDHFAETQHYLPGDFPGASRLWEGAADGDGDWTISAGESAHVMHHLHAAGDDEISYSSGGVLSAGKNVAESPFKNMVYWIHTPTAPVHGKQTASLTAGALVSGSAADGGALTPDQASSLDEKMDDGLPGSGEIYLGNGAGAEAAGTRCVSGDVPPALIFATKTPACVLYYWLGK